MSIFGAPCRTRYAFCPHSGQNNCSHQCLHWWQELSTGQFLCYGFESYYDANKKYRTANAVLYFLAPPVGLEPTTCGLTVRLNVCGARQKLRLSKKARFLPTAAHAAPSLLLPPAALGLAATSFARSVGIATDSNPYSMIPLQ